MRKRSILFLCLSGFFLSSSGAFAAPKLDAELERRLKRSFISNTIPVLVRYRVPVSSARDLPVTSAGKIQRMQAETAIAEQRLFSGDLRGFPGERASLWLLRGSLLHLSPMEIERLRSNEDIEYIHFMGGHSHLTEEPSSPSFGIPLAQPTYTYGLSKIRLPWLRSKYPLVTGKGISVGVLDTGMDPSHPDLVGRLQKFKNFVTPTNQNPMDDHGHGTHVAGTIAGGATSGQAIGVAPEAGLLVAKGFSGKGQADDPNLLLALQWMADPNGDGSGRDAPKLVSNSWNSDVEFSKLEPDDVAFCAAVNQLDSLGVAMVFSAGNDGPDEASVKVPGACPNAITVGGTDQRDRVYDYSSRGPVHWRSATVMKPDLVAPGVDIESAAPGGGYRTRTGTSMSTPHVAGVLALVLQVQGNIKPEESRSLLENGSIDLGRQGIDPIFGSGRTDIFSTLNPLLPQ